MLETLSDFDKYKPAVRAKPNGIVEYRDSPSFGCDALSNPEVIKALNESARKLGPLTRLEKIRVTYGNMNE